MSEVLYRKFRPRTFAEVIGQTTVKTILQNALIENRVAHAYLFTGPRGVGKTTVARLLAKAVNCQKQKKGEPCTKCEHCELIQTGRFLDLVEIDAASYTGVDNIREIIEHVKFTPSRGAFKVFIIDEVHMLSKAAFNALLKTLEEPPAHAIFILATTEIHKVPATIVSRTQRFDFKPVSVTDVLELFKRILPEQKAKLSPEGQKLIARAASGSMRDALSILDQVLSFGEKEVTLERVEDILGLTRIETSQEFLQFLIDDDATKATDFIRRLAAEGKDLVQFSHGLLDYLRLVLLAKTGVGEASGLGLTNDDQLHLTAQAEALTGARLLDIIKVIMESYRLSKITPIPELPLLVSALSLSRDNSENSDEQKMVQSESVNNEKKATDPKSNQVMSTLNSGLDLGTVIDRWTDVLAKVKEYNHSLLSSLRLARLVRLDGGSLLLAFPYAFHKETIEARKNKIIIEQVLQDVYQISLKLDVALEREVNDESVDEEPRRSDLIGEAMRILGS